MARANRHGHVVERPPAVRRIGPHRRVQQPFDLVVEHDERAAPGDRQHAHAGDDAQPRVEA
jgi:hypothetical protein